MSTTLNTPQPPPTSDDAGPEVWPTIFVNTPLPAWLVADMKERHEVGTRKYGTPLRVWNSRDAVVDAYQEALDLVVYAHQARLRLRETWAACPIEKSVAAFNARLTCDNVFYNALEVACALGELARLQSVPKEPSRG